MTDLTGVSDRDTLFLPDLCELLIVFVVIVIGELLAFILVLTASVGKHCNDLAMTSMFIRWVALSGMVLLCVCRRWLRLMENVAA